VWHRRVAGCLLTVALATAGLTACDSGSAPKDPPTRLMAQTVLDDIAKDVVTHQLGDVTGHVDPSSAAASFRLQQRNDFANLAALPLTMWQYDISSLSTDTAAIAAATKRLGAPALIAQVTLKYRLSDVDVLPSPHDLWLTFVRRNGTTYLAGDDDLATQGFSSWVGPWRYGKLGAARGANSLVIGPAGESALLQDLATEVDAAIPQVRAVLGAALSSTRWPGKVAVIVPGSADAFTALTGGGASTIRDDSAVAVTDGIDPVSKQAYGQRLVLNPTTLGQLSKVGRGIVLRHEITHLATATVTSDVTPRWLVEGFAEYVANLGTGQPVGVAASELRAAVRAGKLPTALPDPTAFAATGAALAQLYEQSWLACRYLAEKAGPAGLVRFYIAVGQSIDPGDVALADALRSLLHESLAAFTAGWRQYVQTQLS